MNSLQSRAMSTRKMWKRAPFASAMRSVTTAGSVIGGGNAGSQGASSRAGMIAGAVGFTVGASALYSSTRLNAQAEGAETDDSGVDPFASSSLFPQTSAIEEGTLKVDARHTIAYSVYGNPKGKPVLFVHGGPGGGTDPAMARYFDPKVYKVVLVDQRGCGKSTPFADLHDNTTWKLIEDFEKVRIKLGIDKWQVFGGSWGSTLGLAYAITHPERTTEIVLRGIFLLQKQELEWFYEGQGTKYIYAEEWDAYEAAIPPAERKDGYIKAYGRRLRGDFGEEAMYDAAKAWSVYEGSVSKLRQPPRDKLAAKYASGTFPLAFARIENHFFENEGFFPRDGWLLEDEQLRKIRHIPTVIVHGRYDALCPARTAWELHKRLPQSELHFTTTGHSGFEFEIIDRLVEATEKFKSRK